MPLVGGFGCLELVLYDMRELAQQHYEPLILLQSEIISLLLFSPLLTSNILAPAGGQQRGDISRRSVTWRIWRVRTEDSNSLNIIILIVFSRS